MALSVQKLGWEEKKRIRFALVSWIALLKGRIWEGSSGLGILWNPLAPLAPGEKKVMPDIMFGFWPPPPAPIKKPLGLPKYKLNWRYELLEPFGGFQKQTEGYKKCLSKIIYLSISVYLYINTITLDFLSELGREIDQIGNGFLQDKKEVKDKC